MQPPLRDGDVSIGRLRRSLPEGVQQDEHAARSAEVEDPIVLSTKVRSELPETPPDLARIWKRKQWSLLLQEPDHRQHLRSTWPVQCIEEYLDWCTVLVVLIEGDRPGERHLSCMIIDEALAWQACLRAARGPGARATEAGSRRRDDSAEFAGVRARVEIRKHLEGDLELVPGPDRHVELRGRVKQNRLLVAQEAGGFSPGLVAGAGFEPSDPWVMRARAGATGAKRRHKRCARTSDQGGLGWGGLAGSRTEHGQLMRGRPPDSVLASSPSWTAIPATAPTSPGVTQDGRPDPLRSAGPGSVGRSTRP